MKLIVLTALVFALAQNAEAQNYRITDLGPLDPVAINLWGEVAGNLNNDAYIWTKWEGLHNLGLLPGGTFARAAAINDLGEIAGSADGSATVVSGADATESYQCTGQIQPFFWSPRKGLITAPTIPIIAGLWRDGYPWRGYPCSWAFYATGINNMGQVLVSNNQQRDTYLDGYLWTGSQGLSIIDYAYQDSANGLNDQGMVASQGFYDAVVGGAVLWKGGVATPLSALAANTKCSGANSVNNMGQAVGWSAIAAANTPLYCFGLIPSSVSVHAALWEAGNAKDLGTLPGDISSVALRISPSGEVIGSSGNAIEPGPIFSYAIQIPGRPFVWSRLRGMRDLNALIDHREGWKLNSVADINAWGQIVGSGIREGKTHGFLLTPE